MDVQGILVELRAERDRFDRAITVLHGSSIRGAGNVHAMGTVGRRHRGRRRLSAAAKRRLSEAMKKAWAKRKRAAAKRQ
jgi:hypothetical protein